jgi:hypothetical protein
MAVVGTAAPAAAHGTAQVPATDFDVRLHSVRPAIPGVRFRVVDNGARVELRNDTGTDVTVLGYEGEPYLRVGPDGVFRNRRSPATFLNRQRYITTSAPPSIYNAKAAPEWQRISHGHVTRWHDHRAHYMGSARGGSQRVLMAWTIPMERGSTRIDATGDVLYVPPPSPYAWLATAALIALVALVLARTRAWPAVLAAVLAVLIVAAGLQTIGEWGATTLTLARRIAEHVYVFIGLGLAAVALVWLVVRRRSPYDATPAALIGGLALLLASGLSGIPLLAHSELPTTLTDALDRLLVTVTIGAGLAAVAIAATRLRRPSGAVGDHSSTGTAMRRSMYAEK